MQSPGINGEGELRGQPANPGSPGKMAVKTEYICVCVLTSQSYSKNKKADKFLKQCICEGCSISNEKNIETIEWLCERTEYVPQL